MLGMDKLIIACYFFFIQNLGFACDQAPTDINRNDQNLGPSRDQDSIGYCYAFSAADLYEQWLKKNNYIPADQHISGFALGLADHAQAWDERTRQFNNLGILRNTNLRELTNYRGQRQLELDTLNEQFVNQVRQSMNNLPEYPLFTDRLAYFRTLAQDHQEKANLRTELEATLASMEQSVLENNPNLALEQQRLIQLKADIEHQWGIIIGFVDFTHTDILQSDTGLRVQGGKSEELLAEHWNSICYESEVSSSDIHVKNLYENYRELYAGSSATPDDLSGAIGFLNSLSHEDRNQCANFMMATTLFPGLPFQDLTSFTNWVGQGNFQGSMIQQFLNESCTRKSPPVQPEINITKITSNITFPIRNNENVLQAIDNAITSGKVASIGYNSSILFGDLSPETFGPHESVIVGKANLCGEEAYILRNTYGEEFCDYARSEFKSNESNQFQGALSLTYQCDDQGNFIIPKNLLKDGLYSATTISN